MTFVEYVGFYGLARSEGLVLRYLADAYKALRQTVPEDAKTEELLDIEEWLGELVRQVDSSLIDEWQRLLGKPERYPAEWEAFREECHAAGQTTPTPILLKYGAGGFNALHRDLRGRRAPVSRSA